MKTRYSVINFIHILFSLFIPIILFAQSYNPPIGIPAPEFGIEESHLIYENSLYDFGSGPEPYRDAGNGPYTHYVDKNDPNATDVGNLFGTPAIPRLTIPKNLTPGSVVEVHNGPYNYFENIHSGTYLPVCYIIGTAQKPVFIRGASAEKRFELGGNNKILVWNVSYLIMENVYIKGPTMQIRQPSDHFVLRYSEVTGETGTGIDIYLGANEYIEGHLNEHMVFYENEIHDNGPYPSPVETNCHGIILHNAYKNVWIIDNKIYNNGDDGIHIFDRSIWDQNPGPGADRIFIGRNVIHHDGENAIDVKGSTNVIISQNECYGYAKIMPSSSGEAIRINNEGNQDNIWILYNKIYDSEDGINPIKALFPPYIIGNIIYDCEIAINRDAALVLNNTIYNTKNAFVGAESIINNIISNANPVVNTVRPDIASNNIFWQNGEDEFYPNCLKTDPLFVNANSKDFRLQTGSPAIDNGIPHEIYDTFYNLYGLPIDVDFDGNPRPQGTQWDIGPYEYEGTGTVRHYLSAYISGQGTVLLSPDNVNYGPGTIVTLRAVPDSGEDFIEWSGDLAGTDSIQQITMDKNNAVMAFFTSPITEDFIIDSIEAQSGQFEMQWDAYAKVDSLDGVIGFSQEIPTVIAFRAYDEHYDDLSCQIIFDRTGFLKVNNSQTFTSDIYISYKANQLFHFRMFTDIDAQIYSVWVTPEEESEVLLADSYAFHPAPGDIEEIKYRCVKMSFNPDRGGAVGMVFVSDFAIITGLKEFYDHENIPTTYSLYNYPNPFNPSTTIEFTLPKSEFVNLKIYNILGEEVVTLVQDKLQAGNHTYQFDGSNLASGIYLYRIEAGEFRKARKMVLIK